MGRTEERRTTLAMELEVERMNVLRRFAVAYRALLEIAEHPSVQRNPDGVDQAADTMKLIASDAIDRIAELPDD